MNTGQKLYKKAKTIIPGGNQFLSKRPEMFLPDQWPSYYEKANGCEIWDLDGNKFIDMSIMGIGTCSLGYANKDVNQAVINSLQNGSYSTLNAHEEVSLAEKLIDLHPFMEMVRFARTGGEANSMAIRIARSLTNKSKVAVCGYHGWHDWYLSTNLKKKDGLDKLLLPGLMANGIPKELINTTLPFYYGDTSILKKHIEEDGQEIGAICLEVQRGKTIDIKFLNEVIEIAREINAVIIFDEISSGFRMATGGLYKNYDLEPDMVLLGKALGNGFGITAVMGKRSVMESAQNSFISSSYWSERTGYAAALETIRIFEDENVINRLKDAASHLRKNLTNIFLDLKLDIVVEGLHTVPLLNIKEKDPLIVKTIFTQEMLKKGFLASNLTYISLAHKNSIIDQYIDACYDTFRDIKVAISNESLVENLNGDICHSSFNRLT